MNLFVLASLFGLLRIPTGSDPRRESRVSVGRGCQSAFQKDHASARLCQHVAAPPTTDEPAPPAVASLFLLG